MTIQTNPDDLMTEESLYFHETPNDNSFSNYDFSENADSFGSLKEVDMFVELNNEPDPKFMHTRASIRQSTCSLGMSFSALEELEKAAEDESETSASTKDEPIPVTPKPRPGLLGSNPRPSMADTNGKSQRGLVKGVWKSMKSLGGISSGKTHDGANDDDAASVEESSPPQRMSSVRSLSNKSIDLDDDSLCDESEKEVESAPRGDSTDEVQTTPQRGSLQRQNSAKEDKRAKLKKQNSLKKSFSFKLSKKSSSKKNLMLDDDDSQGASEKHAEGANSAPQRGNLANLHSMKDDKRAKLKKQNSLKKAFSFKLSKKSSSKKNLMIDDDDSLAAPEKDVVDVKSTPMRGRLSQNAAGAQTA